MKKITLEFLESENACGSGVKNVTSWNLLNLPADKFLEELIKHDRFDYANWLIIRLFTTNKQKVQYACFAAKQVLTIFETKYKNDDRPRKAIEAVEEYLKKSSSKTKQAATYAAAYNAYADAYNVCTAACAAHADAAAAHAEIKNKIIEYGIKILEEI